MSLEMEAIEAVSDLLLFPVSGTIRVAVWLVTAEIHAWFDAVV